MRRAMFLMSILLMSCLIASSQSSVINPKQSYTSAVGIKFFPLAVSLKHFVSPQKAIDLYAYFNEGTRITGLYEWHGSLSDQGNLKWYLGPGMHVQFYDYEHGGGTNVGVDGIVGLEYKIAKLPLAISVDWQPSLEFSSNSTFAGGWGGIGGKFTF